MKISRKDIINIRDNLKMADLVKTKEFRAYLSARVKALLGRKKFNLRLTVDEAMCSTACTNGTDILLNCDVKSLTDGLPTSSRVRIAEGLVIHEAAHIVYTDFDDDKASTDALLRDGNFGPLEVDIKNTREQEAYDELTAFLADKKRSAVAGIYHMLTNIIEDCFIEEKALEQLHYWAERSLGLVREVQSAQLPSVEELANVDEEKENWKDAVGEDYKLDANVILNALFGFAKYGKLDYVYGDNPYAMELIRIADLIEAATHNNNGKKRLELCIRIFLELWPFFKDAVENDTPIQEISREMLSPVSGSGKGKSGKGSCESSSVSRARRKIVKKASAGSRWTSEPKEAKGDDGADGDSTPSGKAKGSSETSEEESAAAESTSESSSANEESESSGESAKASGSEEESSEEGEEGTSSASKKTDSPDGEESDEGEGGSEGSDDAGEDESDGGDEGASKVFEGGDHDMFNSHDEAGEVSDNGVDTGDDEFDGDYDGSGYAEAGADDIDKLLETVASTTAEEEAEAARTKALNAQIGKMPFPQNHRNVKFYIRRQPLPTDSQIEAYDKVKSQFAQPAKVLAKKFDLAFEPVRRTQNRKNLYMGPKLHSPAFYKDDGRMFKKKGIPDKRSVAIAVLVDESGSMCCGNRATYARLAALTIHEACADAHIPHMVYGHSTTYSSGNEAVELYSYVEFDETDKVKGSQRMMDIAARSNNRDGAALFYVGNKLAERPEAARILIVISDGAPAASGYYGSEAEKDLFDIKESMAKRGITTFAAAIGDDRDAIRNCYRDGYLDVTDITKLPNMLYNIVKRYLG